LAVEGGHLFIGHNGNLLYYACSAMLHGYDNDAMKAACIAAGLPVIDAPQVAITDLWPIVVSEPEAAVGTPEQLQSMDWTPYASLAVVAGLYQAVGAEVLNLPTATVTAQAAPERGWRQPGAQEPLLPDR